MGTSEGQLANTPQPMFGHDAQHTRRSPYTGGEGKNVAVKWSFTTFKDVRGSAAIGSDGTVYFGANDRKVYALTVQCGGGTYKSQPASPCVTCPQFFYCPNGSTTPTPCSSQEYCPAGSVSPQDCNVSCSSQYFKNISTCSCLPTPVCFIANCSLGSCQLDLSPAGQRCNLSSCAEGGRCDGSGTCVSFCGNAEESSSTDLARIVAPSVLVPLFCIAAVLGFCWWKRKNGAKAPAQAQMTNI